MARKSRKKPSPRIASRDLPRLVESVHSLDRVGVVTIAQARVYCEAATQHDATIGSIAEALEMDVGTVSRLAYALSQLGLLAYEAHPSDRRRKVVRAVTG